ncbi:MAG: NAD(P)H-binding protein [Bryobacteraceae bacterium]
MTILVAGASGAIGREVVSLLAGQHNVHALARMESGLAGLKAEVASRIPLDLIACDRNQLFARLEGVQTVISCVGAPVLPGPADRASFLRHDTVANQKLIEAARAAGVFRFLYLALHRNEAYAETAYATAHERVVETLQKSGMSYTVVEPTGVYSALLELVRLARGGRVPIIGDGSARTNPIDPRDVAQCVADHLLRGPERVPAGGPEVMTRDSIAETAFAVIGKRPRLLHVPRALAGAMATLIGPFHARAADLLEFYAAVSKVDCIAPAYGVRRLRDYFRKAAASAQA